jgi:hypothetical protein
MQIRIDNPWIFAALRMQAKDTEKPVGIWHVLNTAVFIG